LNRLRGDVGDVVGAMTERSRRNVGQMRDTVSDEVSDRLKALNQRYATVRRSGRRWWRDTRRRASEHPIGATIATVGLGALIAALATMVGRRRR
jgi:hypothetical protein